VDPRVSIDDMSTAAHYAGLFGAKCDWTWGAADGAGSRVGPDGARYWLFGDTIVGYPSWGGGFMDGRFMVSNTILVQRGAELGPATYGNGTAAVPNSGDHRYWTTDLLFDFVIANRYSAYVLCQRIHGTVDGFVTDGAQIAEFLMEVGSDLEFVRMWPTPTTLDLMETAEIQWSCGMEPLGDYTYIYGYRQAGSEPGYLTPHRTYVARVLTAALTSVDQWQFWDGRSWCSDKAYAAPILDGQLTSVRRIGGAWMLAHKPWNGWGSAVKLLTASRPQGPFTALPDVPSAGGTSPGGRPFVTYNPTLHKGLPLASGKALLAISHNGAFPDIFAERTLYRPEWLEVAVP
jgi:hypothetical protein